MKACRRTYTVLCQTIFVLVTSKYSRVFGKEKYLIYLWFTMFSHYFFEYTVTFRFRLVFDSRRITELKSRVIIQLFT